MNISSDFSIKKPFQVKQKSNNGIKSPTLTPIQYDTFQKSSSVGAKNNYKVPFGQNSVKAVESAMQNILIAFNEKSKGNLIDDLNTVFNIAKTDHLTGLKNKRTLLSDIQKHISELKKNGSHLTVAMFDMDNFKGVNDLLGYDTGDLFIKTIGSEVNNVFAPMGKNVYRFGGEEFVVLMPNTSVAEAKKMASQARDNLINNKQLKSFVTPYIKEGHHKIATYSAQQAPLTKLNKSMSELDSIISLKKSSAHDSSFNSQISTFLDAKIDEATSNTQKSLRQIMIKALKEAPSQEDKNMLHSYVQKMRNGEDVHSVVDKKLMNYLNCAYNNEAKIGQIEKWLANLQKIVDGKPQGFTITAGVKKFGGKDLDTTPVDIIGKTGQVLSQGKTTLKGQVYS
ncbi:MAG: GGDEF domain-containing protein [Candidatus Gastranaerophilales bacterium]|nr:GGDEF domain-containing protein [Candidatus Gastranaerophilales bacterium]